MSQYLVSEDQVKKALHIDSFRNLSKDKIMEFASLIPHMDKDVAIAIINQFPAWKVKFFPQAFGECTFLCGITLFWERNLAFHFRQKQSSPDFDR